MIRINKHKPTDYPTDRLPEMEGKSSTTYGDMPYKDIVTRFGFAVTLGKVLLPFRQLHILPHEAEDVVVSVKEQQVSVTGKMWVWDPGAQVVIEDMFLDIEAGLQQIVVRFPECNFVMSYSNKPKL